jgi:hypothetical protein
MPALVAALAGEVPTVTVLLTRLAHRAAARLRTGVYGEQVADPHLDRDAGLRPEVRQVLAKLADVGRLEELARDAVASGRVTAMRWPHIVQQLVKWADDESGPEDSGEGWAQPIELMSC